MPPSSPLRYTLSMQTILITGAASGIGLDSALALAKRGYHVIATCRSIDGIHKLEALKRTEELPHLEARLLDITNQDQIDEYAFETIDILINNAGTGETGPLAEIPLDRLRHNYEVNVFGTMAVTQLIAQGMIKRKQGRIITVTSTAGLVTLPMMGVYCSTKHALESLFNALRVELQPFKIPVSLIEPRLIYTGFNERMAATKYAWLNEKSAYADKIPAMKKRDAGLPARSSTTASVVDAIVHAVESKYPKTRYVAPFSYRPMIALLNLLPTRLQDYILSTYV